jgi:hypothetical protein
MTLFDSLKWWICWPWTKDAFKPEKFDVGISVAEAILLGGDLITITRRGKALGGGWTMDSEGRLASTMDNRWILADNKTYYNRDYIFSYEVKTESYWVYADNKPVQVEE